MKQTVRDPHLRCEICDFCEATPSVFNDGQRWANLPSSATVAMRDGKAICNSCEAAHYHFHDGASVHLTDGEERGTLLYSPGRVERTYMDGDLKVTVYETMRPSYKSESGDYDYLELWSDDDKQRWRDEYRASLIEGCVPFRGGQDD